MRSFSFPYCVKDMAKIAIIAFAFFLLMTPHTALGANEEEPDPSPYPIWLSPRSEFQELDSLDDEWTKLFSRLAADDGWLFEGYTLHKDVDGKHLTVVSDDCKSLVEYMDQGFDTELGGANRYFLYDILSSCRYLSHLQQAKSATVSFVRDFELTEKSINVLPALMESGVECQRRCRNWRANKDGNPISKFAEFTQIVPEGPYILRLETEAVSYTVKLLAKADFDNDDVEDLFVLVTFKLIGGTMWGSKNFILTRKEADSVLRVITPDVHLCHRNYYKCDRS